MVEPIKITEAPLSEKWRTTSSKLQSLDLAAIQKSLSNVAGQFSGHRIKSFKFGTGTYADGDGNIVYDVTEVLDMPSPLSAEQVDVIVGKIVHESGHVKVESANTRHRSLLTGESEDAPLNYYELTSLGEEVYTDNYVYRNMGKVAPEYLRRARVKSVDLSTEPEGIYNMLLVQHVYGGKPSAESMSTLQNVELTIYSIANAMLTKVASRDFLGRDRRDLYVRTWYAIRALISSLVQQKQIADDMANATFGFPQDGPIKSKTQITRENVEKAKNALGLKDKEKVAPIDTGLGFTHQPLNHELTALNKKLNDLSYGPRGRRRRSKKASEEKDQVYKEIADLKMAQAKDALSPESQHKHEVIISIQDAIETESEDLTSAIQGYQLAEFGNSYPVNVVYSKAKKEAKEYTEFDTDLYKKLVSLKNLKNTIGKETLRGEERGLVDRHNLYRAGIDGKVFKQIRMKPRKEIKIACLLDASGSMSHGKGIYKAAHALSKVVRGTEVLSYYSYGESCLITRQTSGQGFKEINIGGGTPSGQALLAAARKFPDRMLIHFTDGDSNLGFTTDQAYEIMRKQFPKVKVIDVQMREKGYERALKTHPNVVRVSISEVKEFPKVLQEAIKPWVRGGG